MALGAWLIGVALAAEVVATFVGVSLSGEKRHRRCLTEVIEMERKCR